MTENESTNGDEVPTEAEYRDAEVVEEDAATYEADRRLVGTVVIENDLTRPLLVRRVWEVEGGDGESTVHESTHYYAANEPTESAHVADTIGVEWTPSNDPEDAPEEFLDELRGNLTNDAVAEVEAVVSDATTRTARRKLGLEVTA